MDTYSSASINGQLIPVLKRQALASGNAVGPIYGGGPASPATVPPNASQGSSGGPAANPWSMKSALPWLLIMLVVGVLGLRYIHWRS